MRTLPLILRSSCCAKKDLLKAQELLEKATESVSSLLSGSMSSLSKDFHDSLLRLSMCYDGEKSVFKILQGEEGFSTLAQRPWMRDLDFQFSEPYHSFRLSLLRSLAPTALVDEILLSVKAARKAGAVSYARRLVSDVCISSVHEGLSSQIRTVDDGLSLKVDVERARVTFLGVI